MTQPPTAQPATDQPGDGMTQPPATDQPGYWPPAADQPGFAPPVGDGPPARIPTGGGAAQPRTPAGTAWRVVLVGVISLLSAGAGVVVAFIAAITWSGCFLSCTGENHVGGALLGLLALALVAAGPVLARGLFGRWSAAVWTVLALVVVGPLGVVVVNGV